MKSQDQLDSDRKVYRLTFPSNLTDERVRAWLRSISGTLKTRYFGLLSVPSIVFETWADDQGIVHRLIVPSQSASFIVSRLESLIPGTNVIEDHERPSLDWQIVTEIGMTSPSRQLIIPSAADFSHSLLTSVQSLAEHQVVLTQWIIAPKPAEMPPASQNVQSNDFRINRVITGHSEANSAEIDDRRKKLETPNTFAVGRIAVSGSAHKAKHLTNDVLLALSVASTGANRLTRHEFTNTKMSDRVNLATTPRRFRGQLSLIELSAMIGWPIGSPFVAGLPQSRTRHMHVNNSVLRAGDGSTVIGVSNVPGRERDIAIGQIDRMKHVHIMGPTESGKTSLAASMAEQDMQNGFGMVLIETKRDLFEAVLERVPAHRIEDVIIWDLDDTDFPVGFNVLKQGTSRSAVDELNALLANMYPEGGILTPQVMYHGLHALAASDGGTMIDLPTVLTPQTPDEGRWREEMVDNLKNPEIKKYWQRYLNSNPKEQDRESAPLHRRLWQFAARPEIRNSLGQSESSFQMDDVVRDGKILLVHLNGVRIGQQTASMVGTLIMNAVWNSVRTTEHEKPVMLYMDEFQNFATMPISPSDMLAQSRSFGLGMVLAHQHTGQLKTDLRDAVLANARTKIIFQTSSTDARIMAAELGSLVKPEDLLNLGKREAIARVATPSGVSQPFTMRTKDISTPSSNARYIRNLSRQKYGRPVDEVEKAIEQRRKGTPTKASERPVIGVRQWDR